MKTDAQHREDARKDMSMTALDHAMEDRNKARQAFMDRRYGRVTDEHTNDAQATRDAAYQDFVDRGCVRDSASPAPSQNPVSRVVRNGESVAPAMAITDAATAYAQDSRDAIYQAFMKRRHSGQVITSDQGRTEGVTLMMDQAQRIDPYGRPMEWKS